MLINFSFESLIVTLFLGDKASLEDMMMTMLDERDKLVEHLKATQDQCEMYKVHWEDAMKDNDNLKNQMELTQNPDVSILSKNLNDMQKKVIEQEEEIAELKAERNNTRLLLEHLECLVSRHERSLRMTVVKRQTMNSGGVSSEVEVLKALKSLFEHHKALDEKMREKLKSSFEKCQQLDDECAKLRREKEELRIALEQTKITPIINGPVDPKDQDMVKKLQSALESQDNELVETKEKLAESSGMLAQITEQLNNSQREQKQAMEEKTKYYRDYHESIAQKEDMEKRIDTLEKRYLNAQRENTQIHDQVDKLTEELQNRNDTIHLLEEKVEKLQEDLKQSEASMSQMYERVETLPEVQAELVQKTQALNQIQLKKGTIEEQLQQMTDQMEESKRELERARQREKMNEEHNQRLTSTVDKLLAESNERLQLHLKERMVVLHERNVLQTELENMKKILDEQYDEKSKQMETIRILRQELESSKIESKSLENKLRYSLDVSGLQNFKETENEHENMGDNSAPLLRTNKGRMTIKESPDRVLTLNEQEWDKLQQAQILADVKQAFTQGSMMPQISDCDPSMFMPQDKIVTSEAFYSPPGSLPPANANDMMFATSSANQAVVTDEETLSLCRVLQDQLDAIDKEMKLIEEEKQNTEMRTEELVSKMDCGSLDDLDNISPANTTDISPVWGFNHNNPSRPNHMTLPSRFRNHQYNERRSDWTMKGVEKPPDSPHGSQHVLYNGQNGPISDMYPQEFQHHHQHGDGMYTLPHRSGNPAMNTYNTMSGMGTNPGLKKKQGSFKGSLGKFFGRKEKYRKDGLGDYFSDGGGSESEIGSQESLSGHPYNSKNSNGMNGGQDFDRSRHKKLDLLHGAIDDQIPFAQWTGPVVVAWLELWVGMPAWYVAACRANVKSGAIMSALSDTEIQREIGISNYLHRLKLRLAIQEIVEYTSSSSDRKARIANPLIFGDMNHEWIVNEWLPLIGLPQYRTAFMECLVDARMLSHLTKKDFQRQLKVVESFHRNSIAFGIQVLNKLNYDRKELERLQKDAINSNYEINLLVWSNRMIAQWLCRVGLEDFVPNLSESGLHGGVLMLDPEFQRSIQPLVNVLKVPSNPSRFRSVLEREFSLLLRCAEQGIHHFNHPDSQRENQQLSINTSMHEN